MYNKEDVKQFFEYFDCYGVKSNLNEVNVPFEELYQIFKLRMFQDLSKEIIEVTKQLKEINNEH